MLTACIFSGAVSALIVMAVSPAASNLGETSSILLLNGLQRTAQYTYLFMIAPLRRCRFPSCSVLFVRAVLFFAVFREKNNSIVINWRANRNIALALPVILILLIAAGFSTSAYGQSYPVERARFFAHYLMTIVLVSEGALLGIWVFAVKYQITSTPPTLRIPGLILLVMAFLSFQGECAGCSGRFPNMQPANRPGIGVMRIFTNCVEQGQTDLMVPQFDGVQGVKELDSL